MVKARVWAGLSLAAAMAAAPGPAGAQLWPNGGGPSVDVLRNSQEQWQRLSPPPVDARRVAALPVVPESRVDVGTPVLALPDEPAARPRTTTTTPRRGVRRNAARRGPGRSVRMADESRLERDLAIRERRLQELQRQIDADRARLEQRRGGGGLTSYSPVAPAAAADLAPSTPPPTATLR